MAKTAYALLIYRMTEDLTEAQDRDVLGGHREVQRMTSARGELHAVARLDEPKTAKVVRPTASGKHDVTDGPFIEAKEWLVGFYVLDAASEEDAIAHARTLCPEPGHAIEVRPLTWRWKS